MAEYSAKILHEVQPLLPDHKGNRAACVAKRAVIHFSPPFCGIDPSLIKNINIHEIEPYYSAPFKPIRDIYAAERWSRKGLSPLLCAAHPALFSSPDATHPLSLDISERTKNIYRRNFKNMLKALGRVTPLFKQTAVAPEFHDSGESLHYINNISFTDASDLTESGSINIFAPALNLVFIGGSGYVFSILIDKNDTLPAILSCEIEDTGLCLKTS